MNPRRLTRNLPLATLATCVGLCLTSALGGPQESHGAARQREVVDEAGPATAATLEELLAEPAAWLGRTVRFTFQFHSAPGSWNPYLTRFGARDYAAALAWSDAQLLWDADEFESPMALVFARRGREPADLLEGAPVYGRYEAVGRVVQVFLDHPWIEIVRLERCPEEIGEGAILHASRARRLMDKGSWKLALQDIMRAESSNLPPRAREALARMRQECEQAREIRKLPQGG